jgi:hypothetical protein
MRPSPWRILLSAFNSPPSSENANDPFWLLSTVFYEKVVKVKADVAAILKFFLPIPQI